MIKSTTKSPITQFHVGEKIRVPHDPVCKCGHCGKAKTQPITSISQPSRFGVVSFAVTNQYGDTCSVLAAKSCRFSRV